MGISIALETFEPHGADEVVRMTKGELASARRESFEAGYEAARAALEAEHAETRAAHRATLESNLQALSFTHEEARAHVLSQLAPLLCALTEKVFPLSAHSGLAEALIATLEPAARQASSAPVNLQVHPDLRAQLEAALDGCVAPPCAIREDAALDPGAIELRLGDSEMRIDMDAVLAELHACIDSHLAQTSRTARDVARATPSERTIDHG